jgi:uncharacterized protein YhaN
MRLQRLDLARYGKFTGRVIDFGARVPGEPDLHIVYGPNEAGKSTAFAAYLDLLFGIEQRSPFNFLHPYQSMRIGGALELEEGAREFVRIKRPKNSLLDGGGQPVADGALLGALGGLDRNAYRLMFSLDDDTLEAGGESILESKGDLGQLLFSASAGLADLSRTLDGLRGEAEAFYKYRARSGALAELKAELAELKTQRETIDTLAGQYTQLVAERERASAQYEEALAARGTIQARMEAIQRHLGALPRLAALRALREELQPLADLPEPPPSWRERLPQLQNDDRELATRAAMADAEIAQLSAELEAIAVDEAALAITARMETSAELRARHAAAENDLPELRLQLREAEFAVSGLLTRLGREREADPGRLLLGAATVGTLRSLAERWPGIDAACEAARNELSEAGNRLEAARSRLEQEPAPAGEGRGPETGLAALAAALTTWRASDHTARRRLAERSVKEQRAILAEQIKALRPWTGDAEQLAALVVPASADIASWKEAGAKARQQIEQLEDDASSFEDECARHRAELDAAARIAGIVGSEEAAVLRAARERAWADHRRQLDAASADAFEAALRRDDDVTNARLRHEKECARLQQTAEALGRAEAALSGIRKRLDAARAASATVDDAVAAALAAITPPLAEGTTLAWLEAWLMRREKALEAHAGLASAERDMTDAESGIAASRAALMEAMDRAGLPYDREEDSGALAAAAQAALDREAELKERRRAVEERERELKQRERALANALNADRDWQAAWTKACGGCWLADGGVIPGVAAVREMLDALAELEPRLAAAAGLAERIRKMEADQSRFVEEIAALAGALGVDPAGHAATALACRVEERVEAAKTARTIRAEKAAALDAARARRRDLAEALAVHNERKAEMTTFFGVSTLMEVASRLQATERRADLRRQADDAMREILDALRLPSIAEAEAALDEADRPALETELATLKIRFHDQDERTRNLFSALSKAEDRIEAVGGDDAAARIEEKRRTILLDVEERAMRYLRLRAGIAAAEQALRVYRDEHRSSMMERASAAFRAISRNAYTSLTAQLDKDSEVLIAVAADGASKVASELSKGTRFQLYLALRLAGYYEFARARRAVPFIADDIMETFDDHRAEETIRLFAEMAQVGQVIYLTHHRHLCEIARRIHPAVRMHDLAAA